MIRMEHRLIQEIFGQPTEIPLVEVDVESDKLSWKILCGIIDTLPHGVEFLIGNDLQEVMPLQVLQWHYNTGVCSSSSSNIHQKRKRCRDPSN